MRFRKKPVVIEAMQFTGSMASALKIIEWVVSISPHIKIHWNWDDTNYPDTLHLDVPTLEGPMRGGPDDWIIKGIRNEFYPCKPDIFAATYELADPVIDSLL